MDTLEIHTELLTFAFRPFVEMACDAHVRAWEARKARQLDVVYDADAAFRARFHAMADRRLAA